MSDANAVNELITNNNTNFPIYSFNTDENGNECVTGVGDDWEIKDVLKQFGSNETLTVRMSGADTPSSLGDEGSYEVSTLEITENDLIKLDGNSLLSEYINTKSRFLQGTKQFYFIDGFSSPILEKKINKIRKFHSL